MYQRNNNSVSVLCTANNDLFPRNWKPLSFQGVAVLCDIVDKRFNQKTLLVSECIFKKVCLCGCCKSCTKPEINFMPETCNFIKKETLSMCFPVNFVKVFKNIFFTEHLRTTASEDCY